MLNLCNPLKLDVTGCHNFFIWQNNCFKLESGAVCLTLGFFAEYSLASGQCKIDNNAAENTSFQCHNGSPPI